MTGELVLNECITLFRLSFHAWNMILQHGAKGHLETSPLLWHRNSQTDQYFIHLAIFYKPGIIRIL